MQDTTAAREMAESSTSERLRFLENTFKQWSGLNGSLYSREQSAQQLNQLHVYASSYGLTGEAGLQLLILLQAELNLDAMDPTSFRQFYRFVFFLLRDRVKDRSEFGQTSAVVKYLPIGRAVKAWRLILQKRFRLSPLFCEFAYKRVNTISEDLWRQVHDFSWLVLEDLSNYDKQGAWPLLLDDFVDFIREMRRSRFSQAAQQQQQQGAAALPPGAAALPPGAAASPRGGISPLASTSFPPSHPSTACSPSTGSKRRMRAEPVGMDLTPSEDDSPEREDSMGLCSAAKRLRIGEGLHGGVLRVGSEAEVDCHWGPGGGGPSVAPPMWAGRPRGAAQPPAGVLSLPLSLPRGLQLEGTGMEDDDGDSGVA